MTYFTSLAYTVRNLLGLTASQSSALTSCVRRPVQNYSQVTEWYMKGNEVRRLPYFFSELSCHGLTC